jgi:NAD(P)-dependent dehydrogenase (short-subunit alcohol dehydrogenase family)
MRLAGLVMEHALIIGASGGIGAALADALAARGADVTRLSRSADGLDITDEASVAAHLGALDGPFDRIIVASGILAPAGGAPEKALSSVSADAMAKVFAANAIGPALVLKHAQRLIPRDRACRIAVLTARVGSIGDNAMGGWYSYRAAKAAANQIVHTAAIEIGRKRREAVVVALHPGTVATPFTAGYPAHKKVEADVAAQNLLRVMDGLSSADTGGFFDWAGKRVPW